MVRLLTAKLSENPLRYLTETLLSREPIIILEFAFNKSVLLLHKLKIYKSYFY